MHALRFAALLTALAVAGSAHAQTGRRSRTIEQQQQGAGGTDLPQKQQEKNFPFDTSFAVVSLNGKTFRGERPTFTLDKSLRMRGYGGCNTFATTAFPMRQQWFAVGAFALTKRACDAGLLALEKQFLVALRTAAQWDRVGSTLVIKGQNGELRFEPAI